MIWFNSIENLPYYDATQPCYSEPLVLPTDMILQGAFAPVASITGFNATLMSPDGLVSYENITSYFDVYYFVDPITGRYMFNARLNRFSPEMCIRKCWIIRVTVFSNTGFSFRKYTQRYDTASCCEQPAGISFSQESVISPPDISLPTNPTNAVYTDACGEKLVRLISRFPCYDAFSGEYYDTPTNIISGNASFSYTKITTLRGRFVQRPREIVRQISYNCKLQRAESARVFLLESYDIYPAWKMNEIEGQLHAPYIWVEDENQYKEYQFTGGIVFAKPDGARSCNEIFKLSATLQECTIRQTFGCAEPCGTSFYQGYNSFFIIPQGYNGGNIYDSNKTLIASDIDSFVDWLRNHEGVTDVQIVAAESGSPITSPIPSPVSCAYDYVIGIKTTTQNVYTPASVYFNSPIANNRIYASTFDDISEICNILPQVQCATPVLAYYELTPVECATPVLDYYELQPIVPDIVDMVQYIPDGWLFVYSGSPATPEDTGATVFNNQVKFSIKVRNTGYPMPADDYLFSQTSIGVLAANGRPQGSVIINSENSSLTADQFVEIDEQGIIYYSGPATFVDEGNYSEIQLTDLTFNI